VSAAPSAVRGEQALLLMGGLAHSFLFRAAAGARNASPGLEYRTMTCRADPGADVPQEVFREHGTLVQTP
jgi:hypothetical protein